MPLYQYACRKCDHGFEEFVMAGEKPACPKCRSRRLERLLTGSFALHGGSVQSGSSGGGSSCSGCSSSDCSNCGLGG